MYDSESTISSFIESEEKMLSLEGSEVFVSHDDGFINIDITEYRDCDESGKRRGASLTVQLTEQQVARTSQIISDWLESRTRESFDKSIGKVDGEVVLSVGDSIEKVEVVELRIALNGKGIFFTPSTGTDWPTQIRIPENEPEKVENTEYFKNLLLDIMELSTVGQDESFQSKEKREFDYDVFICHSSDDKEDIVEPLAGELQANGLQVWYDDFEINIGDDIREAIESGNNNSRYGIIVFSENFVEANWAAAELSSLTVRERSEDVQKVLLPLRHDVEMDVIRENTPLLASRLTPTISSENIPKIANQIANIVNKR